MNVSFTKLNDVTGELIVTIEEKDYTPKVNKTLRKISEQRPEKGFRPGHTPKALLEKKYGKSVKYDVINEEVGEAVYNYIRENKINVLGNPMPEADDKFDLDNKDFTFKFKVGIAPEIKVEVNKDMTIPYYTIEVADDMTERQDEALRRRYGEQVSGEEVEGNAIVKGTLTELDENGNDKENGIVNENGIVAPEHFTSEEQKSLFVGKKKGESVVFNPSATCDGNEVELSSMLNIDREQVGDHKGDFRFDIKEIIVLRPAELNEEYYNQVFGKDKVHNEEEYRAAIKDMIASQLKLDSDFRFSLDAREAVMNKVGEVDLPEDILKDYLLQQNDKLTKDTIDEEFAKLRPGLVWQLTRDVIAEQLQVKVTEEDMKNVARSMAQQQFAQYGMTNIPVEALDKYANDILGDSRTRQEVANQAADMKIFSAIKEAVTIDDKTVNVAEFNALFAPAK